MTNYYSESRILLIDDSTLSRKTIAAILGKAGYKNIEEALDGAEGFKKAKANPPDLILLDIMMPNMNGFEFCAEVRKVESLVQIPVLVITALGESQDKSNAFHSGATDLITKPFCPEEMLARVRVHLEKQHLMKQLMEYQYVMKREMQHAKDMQLSLMPTDTQKSQLEDDYHILVHSFFMASMEVSGDLWGIKILSPDKIAIFALDFSGHGVGPALNTFRLHAMIKDDPVELHYDPGKYLCNLNNRLRQLLPTGQFATMFFGVIDIRMNTLSYSAAGYTDPIFFSREHMRADFLDGSGMPLGISDGNAYTTRTTPFSPLDSVFLYSDALIESEGINHSYLTISELKKEVEQVLKADFLSGDVLLSQLFEKLKAFTNNHIGDDLTLSLYTRQAA